MADDYTGLYCGDFVRLRGTFYRWMTLWPEACRESAIAPTVVAVGDRHERDAGDRARSVFLPAAAEVENPPRVCDHADLMSQEKRTPLQGQDLITLAQSLARDAERHAILSASLASQADRLLMAGLRLLEPRPVPTSPTQASQ